MLSPTRRWKIRRMFSCIPRFRLSSTVFSLPRKANKVFVTQPQIAEVVVVAPDQLLINGKAVGANSLWFGSRRKPKLVNNRNLVEQDRFFIFFS